MKKEQRPVNFFDTGLRPDIIKILDSLGFEEPTPVQKLSIPPAIEGRNVLAQAPTGTGKTLAFGLPLMQRMQKKCFPFALILVPTRELCLQVAQELNKVGLKLGVQALPVYGGQSIENQIKTLRRGVQIVVGTPGRIIDHLQRRSLDLSSVGYLVLDEADEMLDMGFEEDIERILRDSPPEAQRLLFSATLPPRIMGVARKYIRDYETISLSRDTVIVPQIRQLFYEVRDNDRFDVLTRLLDTEAGELVLIFCHTKRETDEIATALKTRSYQAEALHGDYSQIQREKVMDKFRKKQISILVATDVAARGIDVSGVTHVVNYGIPMNPEAYVHRIGRTGRAGREGVAITLMSPREYKSRIHEIERITKSKVRKSPVPDIKELIEIKKTNFVAKVQAVLGREKKLVDKLVEEFEVAFDGEDAIRLLTAAFLLHEGIETKEPERPAYGERRGAEGGMMRLFMTLGREDGIEPRDVFKAICDKAGVRGTDIGKIRLHDKFTFIEIREELAEKALEALDSFKLKGKPAKVIRAKERA